MVAEVAGNSIEAVYVRAGDLLLGEIRSGQVRYHESEGIGSVRSLFDASGVTTDKWRYTAFGEDLTQEGTSSNPYRFAGERLDGITGLYQNRARWLDPARGAFLSRDRFQPDFEAPLVGAPYAYSHADPVSYGDPDGHFEVSILGLTITVNVQGNVRSAEAASRSRIVQKARALARRLDIKSYGDFEPSLDPEEQVHHLIEQRFLKGNKLLQKLFGDGKSALSVRLKKDEHNIYTRRWRSFFPRKRQHGHRRYDQIEPEDMIDAIKEVYFDRPEWVRILLADVSPSLLRLL